MCDFHLKYFWFSPKVRSVPSRQRSYLEENSSERKRQILFSSNCEHMSPLFQYRGFYRIQYSNDSSEAASKKKWCLIAKPLITFIQCRSIKPLPSNTKSREQIKQFQKSSFNIAYQVNCSLKRKYGELQALIKLYTRNHKYEFSFEKCSMWK